MSFEMRERQRERMAVLKEVGELLEEKLAEWEHLETAKQALTAVRDEVSRRAEATFEAWSYR